MSGSLLLSTRLRATKRYAMNWRYKPSWMLIFAKNSPHGRSGFQMNFISKCFGSKIGNGKACQLIAQASSENLPMILFMNALLLVFSRNCKRETRKIKKGDDPLSTINGSPKMSDLRHSQR